MLKKTDFEMGNVRKLETGIKKKQKLIRKKKLSEIEAFQRKVKTILNLRSSEKKTNNNSIHNDWKLLLKNKLNPKREKLNEQS